MRGQAGHKIRRRPDRHGISARGEDERARKARDDAPHEHGAHERDVEIRIELARAHKPHEQAGGKAVDSQLDHHGGQIGCRRHSRENARKQGADESADKPERPAAEKAAEQHGDVHGQKDAARIRDRMERHGQDDTERDAQRGDDVVFQTEFLDHRDNVLSTDARAALPGAFNA